MRIDIAKFVAGPLAPFAPVNRCGPRDLFYCGGLRFWDGGFDPDMLYLGKASQLSALPVFPDGKRQLQLLLAEDAPIPEDFLRCPQVKIVSFPGSTDLFALYNALCGGPLDVPRYSMKLTELLELIPSGNFASIAQCIANILSLPVALLAGSTRLIAASCPEGAPAPAMFTRLREIGIYPDYGRSTALAQYAGPVFFAPDGKGPYPVADFPLDAGELFCPIAHGGELRQNLGYLYCAHISRRDAQGNLPVLTYICSLLTAMFRQFIRGSVMDDINFSLAVDKIITGEMQDDAVIANVLAYSSYAPARHTALVTIIPRHNADHRVMPKLANQFSDIWRSAHLLIFQNSQILIFVNSDALPVITDEELELLNARLKACGCTAGVSEPFTRVDRFLRHYYHRNMCAAIVASLQNTDRHYSTYRDAALYQITSDATNMPGLASYRDAFVDVNLKKLVEYDKSHNTEYLTTLRYYWHYNRNSAVICRELHIQRSTLFYRLGKVKELLEQDYNDYGNMIQLSVGMAILESHGELPTLVFKEPPPPPGKTPG